MAEYSCQISTDGLEVFRKLATQFSHNFSIALTAQIVDIRRAEIKARCLASVGELLRDKCAKSPTQLAIAGIYDEVFADCICSLYLAASGLDKPAQLVLRRVLELGVAAVYLWDQPHLFWGWKEMDQDLSFNEITEHLSSERYLKFVASENGAMDVAQLFDTTLARNEYRALSNTVHGKVGTFESQLIDRFRHSDSDWKNYLARIEKIEDLLLDVAKARFRIIRENLPTVQPQITTHS